MSEHTKRAPAELVYDTAKQGLPKGVRLVSQRVRRMLFVSQDVELPLQINGGGQPDHVNLMGQVLTDGKPVEGASVSLDGPETGADRTNDEGEFRMSGVQKGVYSLEVEAEGRVVEVPELELNDKPGGQR
jgi:hypothetical protein